MNDQASTEAHTLTAVAHKKLSDTSSSSPVIVPTPSITSDPGDLTLHDNSRMESVSQDKIETQVIDETKAIEQQETPIPPPPPAEEGKSSKISERKTKPNTKKKTKNTSKQRKRKSNEDSTSETSDEADSESEESSEDDRAKRKRKLKTAAKKAEVRRNHKAKEKKKKIKSKKYDSSSDSTSSQDSTDTDSESETDVRKNKQKATKGKAKKRVTKYDSSSNDGDSGITSSGSSSDSSSEDEKSKRKRAKAKAKRKSKRSRKSRKAESSSSSDSSSAEEATPAPPAESHIEPPAPSDDIDTQVSKVSAILANLKLRQTTASAAATASKLDKVVKKNVLEFKRVDQVYDMKIRDWKLVESNKDTKDEFDCVFTVRRRLNWEGKYQETQVDIKSKVLRNCLQEIFKECKSISLVEDTPQVDPHTLFHYYDEIKSYVKKELKPKLKRARKSKDKKLRTQQIAQCKLLLRYIDEDYTAVRKALKPMLKAGTITYDLVWALFKPNTIAFTPTYGNKDDPRCFRVDFSYEYESWLTQAKSLVVDGRYLEYDGKAFGLGDHQVQIQAFKGHKKITSLSAYPLKYHKDCEVRF